MNVILLLVIAFSNLSFAIQKDCKIEYRFEKICKFYDYSNPNCDSQNIASCKVLRYKQNEYRCPIKICKLVII